MSDPSKIIPIVCARRKTFHAYKRSPRPVSRAGVKGVNSHFSEVVFTVTALLISVFTFAQLLRLGKHGFFEHDRHMPSDSLLIGKNAPITRLSRTFPKQIDEALSLGLDLGVGSCGQALVYDTAEGKEVRRIKGLPTFPNRILYLGVRAFDVPETREKTGITLKNPERREKRRLRITTRRRAWRMWEVRRLLKSHGLLPPDYPTDEEAWKRNPSRGDRPDLDKWRDWHSRMTKGSPGIGKRGPLELRVRGLDEKLEPLDWAAALIHLAKHRGFQSNRKSESVDTEGGKVLQALGENQRRMSEGAYRTVGEMLLLHSDFADRKRNREGSYTATALRADQEREVRLLFQRQRELGNPRATHDLEEAFVNLFNAQYPLQNPLNLLGECPFERGEKRGPRYAPSFELSRALQKLNNIFLIPATGGKVRLADFVRAADGGYDDFIHSFPSRGTASNPGRITWADLRKIFGIPSDVTFADLPTAGRKLKKDGSETIDSTAELEKQDFVTRNNSNAAAKGSYLIRSTIGADLWDELYETCPEQLDQAAYALTFFEQIENDFETEKNWGVVNQMRADGLDARLIVAIEANLRSEKPTLAKFAGTTSMSMLASRKLLPHLASGTPYSEACTIEYGDHRQSDFHFDSITNPVVKSVVQECLKQVVHLIDEVGVLPGRICVEIGRDLGKSVNERNEMKRGIDERTDARNHNRKLLGDELGRTPDDDELLRYELWREQGNVCPYCGGHLGKPIEIVTHTFEIDHILPRSRSHDNSYENIVLVHKRCNQNKKNATPFEFAEIGNGDTTSPGWQRFTATLATLKGIRKQKRRNLLNTTFADDEAKFASRHLNDTRYISRLVTHYLHILYELAGEAPIIEKSSSKRVFVQPGALTALVRKSWGLENLKKDLQGNRLGDKHHAVDALVCALVSEAQRQFITLREQKRSDAARVASVFSKFTRSYELMEQRNDQCRTPRDVPTPWNGFRHDVAAAVDLFTVSRREVRKGRGSLHNDTIYRVEKEDGEETCYSRKTIIDTSSGKGKAIFQTLDDLNKIKDIHSERNTWLKTSLSNWISAGSPIDPSSLPRDPQGAVIRKVTLRQGKKSGRTYPQGYVAGGDQVRLDVFSKAAKRGENSFFLVPVYSYHLKQDLPPSRAIVANKDETEWDPIDDSFEFEFSLWPNSRFEIKKKPSAKKPDGEELVGLYLGINRNTGAFIYADPDDSRIQGQLTAKTGTIYFRKLAIDRLGRESVIDAEKRTWRGRTIS